MEGSFLCSCLKGAVKVNLLKKKKKKGSENISEREFTFKLLFFFFLRFPGVIRYFERIQNVLINRNTRINK